MNSAVRRAVATLVLASSFLGCSHMTLNYHARVRVSDKEQRQFDFRKTYRTQGLAWSCGLTFWAYGGACWLYLGKPFASDIELIRSDARIELGSLAGGNFVVLNDDVSQPNWSPEFTQRHLGPPIETGILAVLTPKPALTPEEFEKTIVPKPDAGPTTTKAGFPEGWPEKWFYETQDYKYWTIVGDKRTNTSEAMIQSKQKADQLVATEFPNPKKPIRYETTHNEIKVIDGMYQSWRVIRVRQIDVAR